MKHALRNTIAGGVLAIAFVINPACYETFTQPSPVFSYGESEMKAATEGTWELTYLATGETIRFTVRQSSRAETALAPRGGLISSAYACSSRSFIRAAAACEDTSMMPLDLVADGHHFEKASLYIVGTDWATRDGERDPELAQLHFAIDGIRVSAAINRAGETPFCWASEPRKGTFDTHDVSVSLRRVGR